MKVRPLVEEQLVAAQTIDAADDGMVGSGPTVHVAETRDRTTKMLIAVAAVGPKGADDVNEYFRREGEPLRLKPEEFTTVLARNSGSKKLFYFDREARCWKLSKLGRNRLDAASHEGPNG
jgi:hypothetical protein